MGSCNCSQNTGCRPDIFDRISTRNAGRRDKSCALNWLFPAPLFVYTIYEKRKPQNITIERLWDWYAIEKPEVELPPFR